MSVVLALIAHIDLTHRHWLQYHSVVMLSFTTQLIVRSSPVCEAELPYSL